MDNTSHAKLIDEYNIEFPPYNKDNVINYYLNEELLLADGYLPYEPVEIPETNRRYEIKYKEENDKVVQYIDYKETQEEADEREAREERERLDSMTLTPSDVERALYKAKGMDFEDLKAFIISVMPDIDIKALNIEFRASLFYRGATFNGQRLFDVIGALIGYTPNDMDYLFSTKELPEKTEDN